MFITSIGLCVRDILVKGIEKEKIETVVSPTNEDAGSIRSEDTFSKVWFLEFASR